MNSKQNKCMYLLPIHIMTVVVVGAVVDADVGPRTDKNILIILLFYIYNKYYKAAQ